VALAYPAVALWREKRTWCAVLLASISLSFVVNMLFVSVSRTALVTMPIMLAVFALLHLKGRSILGTLCAVVVLAGVAFATSPKLRSTAESFASDYSLYTERNEP